ncbi:hypothetical protein [Streptomyces sp. NPDC055793]
MSEKPESVSEIITRYQEAYDKREAGILDFLDDDGKVKESQNHAAYDEHRTDAWSDSHGDLGSLLAELADALSPSFKKGERVIVAPDAQTGAGGPVYFEGEVSGVVIGELDSLGDVEVESDADTTAQYVAPRFLKRADD